jgi:hypothetical protein
MNAGQDAPLVLTLEGAASSEEALMGLWTATSAEPAGGMAFAVQPSDLVWPAAPAVVWQIDLPASPEQAASRLAAVEASLSTYPWVLTQAQARLDNYSARRQAGPGIAFGPDPAAGRAEQALDALLVELPQAGAPLSFGWRETVGGGLAEVAQRCQAFVDRLAQQLAHYAWVETRREGRLLACTVAGWSGDGRTIWRAGAAPLQMAMHHRSLALAMDSRLRLLETLAVVARNAVRLAKLPVLLSLPGGALFALPLAWKFVEDVRREASIGLHPLRSVLSTQGP